MPSVPFTRIKGMIGAYLFSVLRDAVEEHPHTLSAALGSEPNWLYLLSFFHLQRSAYTNLASRITFPPKAW